MFQSPKSLAGELLKNSGHGGVFWTRLRKDIVSYPDAAGYKKNDDEDMLQYFKRIAKLSDDEKVPQAEAFWSGRLFGTKITLGKSVAFPNIGAPPP